MRLTGENFISHLIFHPFDAETKSDKMLALAASIACGIFSLGICHIACAIRNWRHRPPEDATSQDNKIASVVDPILGTTDAANQSERDATLQRNSPTEVKLKEENPGFQVTIPQEVKVTLDNLFKDSPYSIDQLPVYPHLIGTKEHRDVKRELMKHPVMKGNIHTKQGERPFIAIKVDHERNEANFEVLKQEQILFLYQHRTSDPLTWGQLSLDSKGPKFFLGNFTTSTGEVGEHHEKDFDRVHTLLTTNQGYDREGLIWSIAT